MQTAPALISDLAPSIAADGSSIVPSSGGTGLNALFAEIFAKFLNGSPFVEAESVGSELPVRVVSFPSTSLPEFAIPATETTGLALGCVDCPPVQPGDLELIEKTTALSLEDATLGRVLKARVERLVGPVDAAAIDVVANPAEGLTAEESGEGLPSKLLAGGVDVAAELELPVLASPPSVGRTIAVARALARDDASSPSEVSRALQKVFVAEFPQPAPVKNNPAEPGEIGQEAVLLRSPFAALRRFETLKPASFAQVPEGREGFSSSLLREGLVLPHARDPVLLGGMGPSSKSTGTERELGNAGLLRGVGSDAGILLGRTLGAGEADFTPRSGGERLVADGSSVSDRAAGALAQVDRNEFVQRVIQALERARAAFPKSIEVELNPPALGKLRIQVTEQDGELVARIQAQSSGTRTLLLEHLPNLDRQLAEQGVQIQRFHVDQMNTGTSAEHHEGLGGSAEDGAGREGENRPGHREETPSHAETPERSEEGGPIRVGLLLDIADGMDCLI